MFYIIVIVLKRTTCIVWRVNVNTLNLSGKVLFKGAERKKIVAVNEHIARPRFPIGESPGFDLPKTIFRGVKEQTRLYCKRLVIFTNPCEFQFIYLGLCHLFLSC